ncbi:hypothetical protein L1887_37775 [Cichorium endivia]|nr:hypothetical protein L1887_37775 [Cichorium endivia]
MAVGLNWSLDSAFVLKQSTSKVCLDIDLKLILHVFLFLFLFFLLNAMCFSWKLHYLHFSCTVFFYNEILEYTRLKTCPLRIIIKVFTIGLKCPPPPPLSTRLYRPPIGRLPSVFATPNLILLPPIIDSPAGFLIISYSISIDFCSLRDLSFDSLRYSVISG